ncbi:LOB domain-containing protein 27 [Bienertia sinuspersici]
MKGGSSQACAACKYQRRKCESNCPLAPYFPADNPKMFQNAHRLYGVSNIMKTLKNLPTKIERDEAMRSIIYESDMRRKDPVHGCLRTLCQLKEQIRRAEEELFYVNSWLAALKNKEQLQIGFGLGIDPITNDAQQYMDDIKPLLWMQQQQQQQEQQLQLRNSNFNDYMNNLSGNMASLEMKPSAMASQELQCFPQEIDVLPEDYEDTPFDAFPDDQQSYSESKDAYGSRCVSSFVLCIFWYWNIRFFNIYLQ